jgi:hypothetical protein
MIRLLNFFKSRILALNTLLIKRRNLQWPLRLRYPEFRIIFTDDGAKGKSAQHALSGVARHAFLLLNFAHVMRRRLP